MNRAIRLWAGRRSLEKCGWRKAKSLAEGLDLAGVQLAPGPCRISETTLACPFGAALRARPARQDGLPIPLGKNRKRQRERPVG